MIPRLSSLGGVTQRHWVPRRIFGSSDVNFGKKNHCYLFWGVYDASWHHSAVIIQRQKHYRQTYATKKTKPRRLSLHQNNNISNVYYTRAERYLQHPLIHQVCSPDQDHLQSSHESRPTCPLCPVCCDHSCLLSYLQQSSTITHHCSLSYTADIQRYAK